MRVFMCTKRTVLGRLLLGVLGIHLLAFPAAAATTWGGIRSGLPWASGGNGGLDELEALRGRRLDVRTAFFGITTWSHMAASANGLPRVVAAGGRLVIGLGMLPHSHTGQHQQCADGKFDTQIQLVGESIVRKGGSNAIIRLGWEANRMGGYPWAVTDDGTAYKACFRRWISILRAMPGQGFTIDWNMAQVGTFPYHIDRMYPGDDVVDVIGVQQYDRCAPAKTEAAWTAGLNRQNERTRSPIGLGQWLAYAKSKGKRLSVPEWGIGGPRDVCGQPGIDNAFFIRKMHAFFAANASSIAYEAYFNGHGSFGSDGNPTDRNGSCKLAPTNYNPLAASAYRTLWSSGVEETQVQPPPPSPSPIAATLSIQAASYYGSAAMCDAMVPVSRACNGHSSCVLRASDNLCGDPQPTVLKRFEVLYTCRNGQKWNDVIEGTIVTLQCN